MMTRSSNYGVLGEIIVTALITVLICLPVIGQIDTVLTANAPGRLKYNGAPGTRDLMLQDYAEKTGRTLLLDPSLPQANIVLRSQTELTLDEYLEAIERALRMHGIALVPVGKKFLKVVPVAQRPLQEGMLIKETLDGDALPETGQMVSQMITLKHIDIPEATKVIQPFKHTYGFIHPLERSNSILITDTATAVNRMVQVIKHIDQPIVAREEPNVVEIRYAKASEIKAKLEEIIKESLAEQEKKQRIIAQPKAAGQPGFKHTTVPGVIRAAPPARTETAQNHMESLALDIELAERGVIRGKVQIVADDRTNLLIIITRPENMKFFNRIIEVLDVETGPDVIVQIFRLEFADAENVASMLNDLISKKGKDAAPAAPGKKDDSDKRSAALEEYVSKKGAAEAAEQASKVGELSAENIKILADKRTNALIIMASESDVKTLTSIIKDMDMMLSQVLIEAVILDVSLDDVVQTGIDWVQRAMVAYDDRKKSGGKKPLFAFAGGGGGGTLGPLNTVSLTSASKLGSSMPSGHGLSYYFTHFGLNLDVILSMSANDTRTQIISSPVIVTHDNTEAKIESSVERYFFKGKRWISTGTASGTYEDDVESKKISLTLTVTPHINTNKLVVMDIHQQLQELGSTQTIGDTDWPTINTREMKASISVSDKETIVLGGLIKKDRTQINKGIPFIRSIPLIGRLFSYRSHDEKRSEIIVFITPYVLNNPGDIQEETARRKEALSEAGDLWKKGWSDSKLAAPTQEQKKEMARKDEEAERARKKAEREKEKAEKEELERKKAEEEQKAREEELRKAREAEEARIEAGKKAAEEVRSKAEARAAAQAEAESEARRKIKQEADPLHDLDPDLVDFIKQQEKRWDRKFEKVDEAVEQEMLE